MLIKFILLPLFVLNTHLFALEQITLRIDREHGFQYAGYYAALHNGYYEEVGLDVRIMEPIGGGQDLSKILSEEGQYGTTQSDTILRAQGELPIVLGTFFQLSPKALVFQKDKNISSLPALKGKRVAITPESADFYIWLKKEGIDSRDIQIIKTHRADLLLSNAEVDAAFLYPIDTKYKELAKLYPPSESVQFYGGVLFTSSSEANRHPQRAIKFLEATKKGWEYALKNRETVAVLISQRYQKGVSPKEIAAEGEELGRYIAQNIVELGSFSKARWQEQSKIMDKYYAKTAWPKDELYFDESQGERFCYKSAAIFALVGVFALILFFAYRRQIGKFQESQIKYKLLYDKAPLAFLVIDRNGTIIEYNKNAEKIFGFSAKEAIGKSAFELLVPDEIRDELLARMEQLLQNRQEFVSINKNITQSGKIVTCEWTNSIQKDKNNNITGILSIVNDISDKEEMSLKLDYSEKMFKTMLDSAPFGIIVTDFRSGEILLVNESAAVAVGERGTNHAGKTAASYWANPSDREIYLDEMEHKGFIENFEAQITRSDGSLFWAQISAKRMVCDKRDSAFIGFTNIDKQVKLRETVKITQTALEEAPCGFIVTDKNAKITYVNRAFTEITGYSKDDAIGRTPSILKSGIHTEEFYKKMWETINSGKVWRSQMQNRRKNGEPYIQLTAIAPIKDENQAIVKFVSAIVEVHIS